MAKKRKKKSNLRKLQDKALNLFKEVCYLRDGKQCMVKKYFPWIQIAHTEVFQVDHCISRQNKWLFIESKNGTVVCSTCNRAKGFKQKSIERAIDDIVKRREGEDWFKKMVEIDQKMSPNPGWQEFNWIEEQIKILEELKQKYENKAK